MNRARLAPLLRRPMCLSVAAGSDAEIPAKPASALSRVYANASKLLSGKPAAGAISLLYLGMVARGLRPDAARADGGNAARAMTA